MGVILRVLTPMFLHHTSQAYQDGASWEGSCLGSILLASILLEHGGCVLDVLGVVLILPSTFAAAAAVSFCLQPGGMIPCTTSSTDAAAPEILSFTLHHGAAYVLSQ